VEAFGATDVTHLLTVQDVERSRDWYVNVLGAELYREYGGTSVVLKLMGSWILLVTGGGPTEDKPDVTFVPPSDPTRVSRETIFRVDDCRGVYETLRSRGAEFLTPPVDHGHEVRAFFRDPDGYLFEISELVS
jgi:catechol 2,3-dioxygenase-like lactoylglutathione lyase family enzyme